MSSTSLGHFQLSPNSKVVYEPKAGYRFGLDTANALGYRGPLYSASRVLGTFRIAILGDSISEGLLIKDYRKVYAAILEQRLRTAGSRAEVMNFGVVGYDTMQEVETFNDKAVGFDPDLILLQYALNDTYKDDGHFASNIVSRVKEQSSIERMWDNPLFLTSALYRFAKYRIFEHSPLDSWEHWAGNSEVTGLMRREEALDDLKRWSVGRCVLVAIFPWFERGLDPYVYSGEHARISASAEQRGFLVADLLPAFQGCAHQSAETVNIDHVHPSEFGHACAGNALASFLLNNELPRRCAQRMDEGGGV